MVALDLPVVQRAEAAELVLNADDLHTAAIEVARRLDVALRVGLIDLEHDAARVGVLGVLVVDGDDEALLPVPYPVETGVQVARERGDAALARDVGRNEGDDRAATARGGAGRGKVLSGRIRRGDTGLRAGRRVVYSLCCHTYMLPHESTTSWRSANVVAERERRGGARLLKSTACPPRPAMPRRGRRPRARSRRRGAVPRATRPRAPPAGSRPRSARPRRLPARCAAAVSAPDVLSERASPAAPHAAVPVYSSPQVNDRPGNDSRG